jgi:hypothetical protein
MRRKTRRRLRAAGVVLLGLTLVAEGARLRAAASHKVIACLVGLDDAGRVTDVSHLAERELAEDGTVAPALRQIAARQLALSIAYGLVRRTEVERGFMEADSFDRNRLLLSAARMTALLGLERGDRDLVLRANAQRLAECGVPEPISTDRARAWFMSRHAMTPEKWSDKPPDLPTFPEGTWDAFNKEEMARRTRLANAFPPTRRPLR